MPREDQIQLNEGGLPTDPEGAVSSLNDIVKSAPPPEGAYETPPPQPSAPYTSSYGVRSPLEEPANQFLEEGGPEFFFKIIDDAKADRNRQINERLAKLGPGAAQFEPDGEFDGGFLNSMFLSRLEDMSNKQEAFRKEYPFGDLIVVNTTQGSVYLARQDAVTPFREIGWAPHLLGAAISEPMLANIGSAILTRNAPGIFKVGGAMVAEVLGLYAQKGVNAQLGYKEELPLKQALLEGGIAGGMEAAGGLVHRMIFGRALTQSEREAAVAGILAAKDLGITPLAIGQTGSPLFKASFTQAGQFIPRVEQLLSKQGEDLLRVVKEGSTDVPPGVTEAAIKEVAEKQQAELSSLIKSLKNTTSLREAGSSIQKALDEYAVVSDHLAGMKYAEARSIGAPVSYDFEAAALAAKDVKEGIRSIKRTVEDTEKVSFGFVPGPTPAKGKPGTIKASGSDDPQLSKLVDDILAVDPSVVTFKLGDKTHLSFDQVKAFRNRAFHLRQSMDGETRAEAAKIHESLRFVMENPLSPDPTFNRVAKEASAMWAQRETNLEKAYVAGIMSRETPDKIAESLFKPGNYTALKTIKEIIEGTGLPKSHWESFRQGFITDVLTDPSSAKTVLSKLDRFSAKDSDGLSLLVSPTELSTMKEFLSKRDLLENSYTRSILDRMTTDGEKFLAMAKVGTAGELRDAVMRGGGLDSMYAQAARAGVYSDILRSSLSKNKRGVDILDVNKLNSAITEWKKSGKLDEVFRLKDWQKIENIHTYSALVGSGNNIAGALARGEFVSDVAEAPFKVMTGNVGEVFTNVVMPLLQYGVLGHVLASPATVLRISQEGVTRAPISQLASAMAVLNMQLERGYENSVGARIDAKTKVSLPINAGAVIPPEISQQIIK